MITSGAKSVKICLILDPGCVCQTIVINLINGALAQQSSKQGIYQRAEKVNGKTSWISPNNINAIWFDTDKFGTIYDDWIIGSLGKLGGNFGGIASTGNQGMSSCPYNVSMDAWKYLSNSHQWIIADANDVSIECLTKGESDLQILLHFLQKDILTLDVLEKGQLIQYNDVTRIKMAPFACYLVGKIGNFAVDFTAIISAKKISVKL